MLRVRVRLLAILSLGEEIRRGKKVRRRVRKSTQLASNWSGLSLGLNLFSDSGKQSLDSDAITGLAFKTYDRDTSRSV